MIPTYEMSRIGKLSRDISKVVVAELKEQMGAVFLLRGFPGGSVVKNLPANEREASLIPQ